jgi:hypothetical protein
MRRLVLMLGLLALMGGALLAIASASEQDADAPAECQQPTLLVKFHNGADAETVIATHGLTIVSTDLVAAIGVYELAAPPGAVQEKLAALQADRAVEFAELNQTYSVPAASTTPPGACGTG